MRYFRLFYGVVTLLFLGLVYGWSILKVPLAEAFQWPEASLSLTFTFSMCAFCVFGLIGSIICKKAGPRVSFLVSALMCLIGFILASTVQADGIALIHLAFGLLIGGGIGISYNALLTVVTPWFPSSYGLASGLLFFGFGLGSLILGVAASSLFQTVGWRPTYVGLGICMSVILAVWVIIARTPSQEELAALTTGNPSEKKSAREKHMTSDNFSPKQMMKTPAFYLYFIANTLIASVGLAIINSSKQMFEGIGGATATAIFLVGFISVCNGIGRIIFGAVYDRIGFKRTFLIATILFTVVPIVAAFSIFAQNTVLLFLAAAIGGLAYGILPTGSSYFSYSFFGKKHYSTNIAILNLTLLPASFIGPLLSGTLHDATGSYFLPLCISAGTSIVAIILVLLIKRPKTPKGAEGTPQETTA